MPPQPAAPKVFTLAFPSLAEALSPEWQWSALAMRRAPVPKPFVMGRRESIDYDLGA